MSFDMFIVAIREDRDDRFPRSLGRTRGQEKRCLSREATAMIHWVFAEGKAADVVRKLFKNNRNRDLARIDIEAMPWREGMK